jgi:hypothetical protein
MPGIVFTLTTSVRPPIQLSDFVDGFALNPPYVAFNASSDGSLKIDFHSSTSLAAPGTGDIQSWTQAIVSGPQIVKHDLTTLGGETGYFHYYLTKDALTSNKLVAQQITVPTTWSPVELFLSGRKGAFWDCVSTNSYSDLGRASLAGDGVAVACVSDLSGNGNHACQITGNKRPIMNVSGQYIIYDGSNDLLTATVDLDGSAKVTTWAIYDLLTQRDCHVMGINGTPYLNVRIGGAGENQKYIEANAGSSVSVQVSPTLTEPMVHIGEADIAAPLTRVRANGGTASSTSSFGSGSNWGAGKTVILGSNSEFGGFAHCRFYTGGVINDLLTTDEMTALQDWAKTRGGVSW